MTVLKLCEDLVKVPTVHNQRSQLQLIKEGFTPCMFLQMTIYRNIHS